MRAGLIATQVAKQTSKLRANSVTMRRSDSYLKFCYCPLGSIWYILTQSFEKKTKPIFLHSFPLTPYGLLG